MISFIIPVHNAEKTISRAIKSIVGDCEDTNNEIIVVENGSSDDTVKIVKNLQQQYKSIIMIHSGKGVSKARNAGLEIAKGEWVVFIDADDFLENDAVDMLGRDINNLNVDFIVYSYKAGNQIKYVTSNSREKKLYLDEDVELCKIKMIENPTRYMPVWSKVFKKVIIDINNLRFNENMCLSEDSDFTLRYMKHCESICLLGNVFYHYSVDNPSTMRTYDGTKTKQYIIALQETSKNIDNENNNIKNAFRKYVLMHMNLAMVREIYSIDNPLGFIDKYKAMMKLKRKEIFKKAIDNTKLRECLSVRMLPTLFFKVHLSFIAALIFYIRAVQNCYKEKK